MKKVLYALAFLFILASSKNAAFAQSNHFDVSSYTTLQARENGITLVTQKIQIKNKTDSYYVPSYGITIGVRQLRNIKVYNKEGPIPFTQEPKEDLTHINIKFTKRITGVNNINEFYFYYESDDIAKQIGNVYEVTLPGLSNPNDFVSYDVEVKVPKNFGKPIIIKPPKTFNQSQSSYIFSKEDILTSGVSIIFGSHQFYKFNLTYHLSNSNLFPIKTEIAIPPDTNYQDVLVNSINPKPLNAYQDFDGNYLATFTLKPRQKLDVKVEGIVKVYGQERTEELSDKQKLIYTKQDQYWETTSPEIIKASKNLKTGRDIYDFVVKTLSYNYDKVIKENKRLGAKNVLLNPSDAVCLEFTDLFIALARKIGIPARSVEGYAYTENSKLRPLSLVKDILHAWPEYYDFQKRTWIMVDPTWGNTTKGIDYFSALDFEHVTFVIKGKESTYPIPAGGYKNDPTTQDVEISFAKREDFTPRSYEELNPQLLSFYLSGFPVKATMVIKNTGNTKITKKALLVQSDVDNKLNIFNIENLPPFGSKSFAYTTSKTPFLSNKDYQITMQLDGEVLKRKIKVGILPDNIILYAGGGIFVSLVIGASLAFKVWRIFIQKRV